MICRQHIVASANIYEVLADTADSSQVERKSSESMDDMKIAAFGLTAAIAESKAEAEAKEHIAKPAAAVMSAAEAAAMNDPMAVESKGHVACICIVIYYPFIILHNIWLHRYIWYRWPSDQSFLIIFSICYIYIFKFRLYDLYSEFFGY